MQEFPTTAMEIAEYFEDTYIGRILPNKLEEYHNFQSEYGINILALIWTQLVPTSVWRDGTMGFKLE